MDPATIIQGAGVVASIFGKDKGPSLRKQRNNMKKIEEDRYTWMVKGARKAGFNPSSVLGAVGGNFANATPIPQSPMNNLARVGNVLMDFADAIDPVRAETERLNNEILSEELTQIRQQNENPLGRVPVMRRTQSAVREDAATAASNAAQAGAAETFLGSFTTGFGTPLTPKDLVKDTEVTALTEQSMKNVYSKYGLGLPSWFPTGDFVEQIGGDDSFLTRLHSRALLPVMAYHNKDQLLKLARDKLKPYRVENNRKADRRRTAIEHQRGQRGGGSKAFMKHNFPTVFD